MLKNLGLLFKKQAKKNYRNTCLDLGKDNIISYGKIDSLSDSLASYFFQEKGIREGDRICIESKKNLFSYVALLSCLKLGVIYSFFDVNDGESRINNVINTVKPKNIFLFSKNKKIKSKREIILVNEKFEQRVFFRENKKIISKFKNKFLNAYIMFTSGSTGKPKGVLISHYNLTFFINWVKMTFKIDKNTKMSNLNPLHFDNSVFDVYGSIFNNATLIPVEKNEILVPKNLIKKLKIAKCNLWFSVPSLLDLILHIGGLNIFKKNTLKKMIFGGERFPLQSVKKILSINKKIQFYNVSGPTECTCMCSSYKVKSRDLKGKDVYVGKISKYFNYKIIGKQGAKYRSKNGELYLEGPAVSPGYFNDRKRTKEKFYKVGKFNGYKTGDIVMEEKNKLLKIIGRTDNQIKFLGHRIELEEIEKAFIKLFGIKNCIAAIKKKKQYPHKNIVIFLDKKIGNEDKIKFKLSKLLPKHMIPEEIKFVRKFAYNSNGKLDRTKY
jgi:D-alanine--poly(phosphoribitol) ligase subunit 1